MDFTPIAGSRSQNKVLYPASITQLLLTKVKSAKMTLSLPSVCPEEHQQAAKGVSSYFNSNKFSFLYFFLFHGHSFEYLTHRTMYAVYLNSVTREMLIVQLRGWDSNVISLTLCQNHSAKVLVDAYPDFQFSCYTLLQGHKVRCII